MDNDFRLTWTVLVAVAVGSAAAAELPPGAPVPVGKHPRLHVTGEEIAATKERARREPWVQDWIERTVHRADTLLTESVSALPPKHDNRHSHLASAAEQLGYAALFTGKNVYADKAKQILLRYADELPKYPYKPEAHIYTYSLPEANWLCVMASAADLAFASGRMSEAERKHLSGNLLRPVAEGIMRAMRGGGDGHHKCYNFQAWHCAAVGSVGFLLDDKRYIEWALNDAQRVETPADGKGNFFFGYGFRHLVKHDIRDDGMFWERSPGYHFYVVNATVRLCEAALRSGVDLWSLAVPDDSAENEPSSGNYTLDGDNGPKSFGMMFEGPLYLAGPDFSVDALADSGVARLEAYAGYYELAYTRTRSPLLAWFLNRVYEKRLRLPLGWSTFSPQGTLDYGLDTARPHSGKGCGRIDARGDRARGAWVSEQVRLQPGKKYRLSVAYRTQGTKTERPARARLEFYPAQGGAIAALESFMPGGEPSGEWKALTHEFATPPKAERFGMELFLWADVGTVWYDDLKLSEVGSDKNLFRYGDFEGGLMGRHPQNVLPWNTLPDIPSGVPPVRDGAFARNGVARAGATLFPSTGLAVLRSQDEHNLCARLTFGPYGGGHGHPDKLAVSVFAHGQHLIPDLPTASYESPLHASWTNQTISHNTVTVDCQTQRPRSKWGHDRAEDPVMGRLECFHGDDLCQIVRATCDNAYPGTVLDRTLCLAGDVLLDVFTVTSSAEHTYDWALRSAGRIEPVAAKLSTAEPLGKGDGYELLRNVESVAHEGKRMAFLFRNPKQPAVRVVVFGGEETQFFLADAPGTTTSDNAPMLVARRKGQATTFVAAYSAMADPVEVVDVHVKHGAVVVRGTRGGVQWGLTLLAGDAQLVSDGFTAKGAVSLTMGDDRGDHISLIGVTQLTLNGRTEELAGPCDLRLEQSRQGACTVKQRWPTASTGGVFVPTKPK